MVGLSFPKRDKRNLRPLHSSVNLFLRRDTSWYSNPADYAGIPSSRGGSTNDKLCFIYAGRSQDNRKGIHPHASYGWRYVVGERDNFKTHGKFAAVGIHVHEYGHILNLRHKTGCYNGGNEYAKQSTGDFYTHFDGSTRTVPCFAAGALCGWGSMQGGAHGPVEEGSVDNRVAENSYMYPYKSCPSPYEPFALQELSWGSQSDILRTSQSEQIDPGNYYLIDGMGTNEFMLVFRTAEKWGQYTTWYQFDKAPGLLIWKSRRNTGGAQFVRLIPADGRNIYNALQYPRQGSTERLWDSSFVYPWQDRISDPFGIAETAMGSSNGLGTTIRSTETYKDDASLAMNLPAELILDGKEHRAVPDWASDASHFMNDLDYTAESSGPGPETASGIGIRNIVVVRTGTEEKTGYAVVNVFYEYKEGQLAASTSWSGDVYVGSDIIIPAELTLTINSNATVHFLTPRPREDTGGGTGHSNTGHSEIIVQRRGNLNIGTGVTFQSAQEHINTADPPGSEKEDESHGIYVEPGGTATIEGLTIADGDHYLYNEGTLRLHGDLVVRGADARLLLRRSQSQDDEAVTVQILNNMDESMGGERTAMVEISVDDGASLIAQGDTFEPTTEPTPTSPGGPIEAVWYGIRNVNGTVDLTNASMRDGEKCVSGPATVTGITVENCNLKPGAPTLERIGNQTRFRVVPGTDNGSPVTRVWVKVTSVATGTTWPVQWHIGNPQDKTWESYDPGQEVEWGHSGGRDYTIRARMENQFGRGPITKFRFQSRTTGPTLVTVIGPSRPTYWDDQTGVIATYRAYSDGPRVTVAWSLDNNSGSRFTIGRNNGRLNWAPGSRPAYDPSGSNNTYTVTVMASLPGGVATGEKGVTVTVKRNDPGSVSFTGGDPPTVNTDVTARLSDRDKPESEDIGWTWNRVDAAGAVTDIPGNPAGPSYRPVSGDIGFFLQATASYNDDHSDGAQAIGATGSAVVDDTPRPGEDLPPTVSGDESPSVDEGSTVVGKYTAEDPEDETITWDPPEGADKDLFTLGSTTNTDGSDNPNVKELRFKSAKNYETERHLYNVTIKVTDPAGQPGTRDVEVSVNNIDDPGEITLSSGPPMPCAPISATLRDEDGAITFAEEDEPEDYEYGWTWTAQDSPPVRASPHPVAVSTTYTPKDRDVGKTLHTVARYGDAEGPEKRAVSGSTTTVVANIPRPPGSLAGAAGDGQVDLSWTAPDDCGSDITHYDYRVRPNPSGAWSAWQDTTATSVTVSPLTNDVEYTFEVRAHNARGASRVAAITRRPLSNATLTLTADDPPYVLTAMIANFSHPGAGTVTGWAWYRLTRADQEESSDNHITGQITNRYVPREADLNHWIRVIATYNDASAQGRTVAATTAQAVQRGDHGGTITFTGIDPPLVNREITATLHDDDNPTNLAWQWDVVGAAGARPEGRIDEGNTYTPGSGHVGSRIRAQVIYDDDFGTGKIVRNTTPVVQASSTLTLREISKQDVRENTQRLAGVYESIDPQGRPVAWSLIGTDPTSFQLRDVSGHANRKELRFKTAPNYEGQSSYSVTVRVSAAGVTKTKTVPVTVLDGPDTGTITLAPTTTQTCARIVATLRDEDSGLHFNQSLAPAGFTYGWLWDPRYFPSDGGQAASVTTQDYTPPNSSVGQWIEVTVRYGDDQGDREEVLERSSSRVLANTPRTPGRLAGAAGDGQVDLSWTAPDDCGSDITHYDYRVRPNPSGAWSAWQDTTATSVTVSPLTNDVEYTFEVRAHNGRGASRVAAITRRPLSNATLTLTADDPPYVLTAMIANFSHPGAGTVTGWAWYRLTRADQEESSDNHITGQITNRYVPREADLNHWIRVIATYNDASAQGRTVAATTAQAVQRGDPPGTITFTGIDPPLVNREITATLHDDDNPTNLAWQWDVAGAAGARPEGRIDEGNTYTPGSGHVGSRIRAQVIYDDDFGTEQDRPEHHPCGTGFLDPDLEGDFQTGRAGEHPEIGRRLREYRSAGTAGRVVPHRDRSDELPAPGCERPCEPQGAALQDGAQLRGPEQLLGHRARLGRRGHQDQNGPGHRPRRSRYRHHHPGPHHDADLRKDCRHPARRGQWPPLQPVSRSCRLHLRMAVGPSILPLRRRSSGLGDDPGLHPAQLFRGPVDRGHRPLRRRPGRPRGSPAAIQQPGPGQHAASAVPVGHGRGRSGGPLLDQARRLRIDPHRLRLQVQACGGPMVRADPDDHPVRDDHRPDRWRRLPLRGPGPQRSGSQPGRGHHSKTLVEPPPHRDLPVPGHRR